jgi:hypothetical protein
VTELQTDRGRFLADVRRGRGDYTTSPYRGLRGEPEAIDAQSLDDLTASATARHQRFTVRRAAEHGILLVLADGHVMNANRVKARVSEALGCDRRTIERAAADMPQLSRRRGYRGSTTWQILNGDSPARNGEAPISDAALRQQIATRILGERQSPIASQRDLAAELIATEIRHMMGADEIYEDDNGIAVTTARAPHDHDWRPRDGRATDPQRQMWRQGPGHRITGHRAD